VSDLNVYVLPPPSTAPLPAGYTPDPFDRRKGWRQVGTAKARQGGGYTVEIYHGLAVSGRLVLAPPEVGFDDNL
jgi:hypothetical protein